MNMDKKTKSIIVVVVLIIGAILGYFYYKRTPTYTFSVIKTAVQKNDWDTFSKHVDTENLISTSYDAFVESALETDTTIDDTSRGFVVGFAKMLKGPIVQTLNDEVKEYIKTGKVDKAEAPKGDQKQQQANAVAQGLKEKTNINKMTYKGIQSTKKDGNFNIATVAFHDSQLDKDFNLDLKMRQLDDGTWQIVQVANLKEYLLEEDKAKKAKLAEINAPIQEKLNEYIAAGAITLKVQPKDAWGFSYALALNVPMTVHSDKALSKVQGQFEIVSQDNKPFYIPFTLNWNIKEGSKTISFTKDLNPFISSEAKWIKADLSKAKATIHIKGIIFADGSKLEIKKKLD